MGLDNNKNLNILKTKTPNSKAICNFYMEKKRKPVKAAKLISCRNTFLKTK